MAAKYTQKEFVERIKIELDLKTDAQLGDALGVTLQAITYWKNGRTKIDWSKLFDTYPDADWGWVLTNKRSLDVMTAELRTISKTADSLANKLQKSWRLV